MGLLVINPGVSATVQDPGRPGYRAWGVPVGGAFDRRSACLANALVGNVPDCAVLELTLFGGIYEAQVPLALALAGAPFTAVIAVLSGADPPRPLVVPQSFSLAPGDRLVLGGSATGARAYLAVRGGWRTSLLLGSRSREDRLKAGDLLDAEPGTIAARRPVEPLWEAPDAEPLRIVDGPDAARAAGFDAWARQPFRVGREASRMGLRLEGPALAVAAAEERLSAPVAPGAVQIAGGRPIILGVACGTVGGYPHVAHIVTADLDRAGQLRPGDLVTFRRVSIKEARALDLTARRAQSHRLLPLRALARDDLHATPRAAD